MKLYQSLLNRIDEIVEIWVHRVEEDEMINSDTELTYLAIRDNIPDVLQGLAIRLHDTDRKEDPSELLDSSFEHGELRAEQGFNPEEIAREYRILRKVLHEELSEDLVQLPQKRLFEAVQIINDTIDGAIARCFQSYMNAKLKNLEELQKELVLTNQELTRLVEDNQDRLSYLTHELKNPLTSIIGYSSLLLKAQKQKTSRADSSRNLDYIETVLGKGRQLLRLINDAAEIARYQTGQMKLKVSEADLCETLDNTLTLFESAAEKKQLTLSGHCNSPHLTLETDTLRLQQIFTNLVSNAIRYTQTGSVTASVRRRNDGKLELRVSDTGIGIAPEDRDRIFELYYRAENRLHDPESTGLGLAIVAQLVDLLQGEIHLTSQVDVGSTFTIVLPPRLDTRTIKTTWS